MILKIRLASSFCHLSQNHYVREVGPFSVYCHAVMSTNYLILAMWK